MGNERNPWVVVALRPMLLFRKDINGSILPLLGGVSGSLHINKEVVEVTDTFGVVKF